jgi:DNA-binding HxlR family transcriptional regulator
MEDTDLVCAAFGTRPSHQLMRLIPSASFRLQEGLRAGLRDLEIAEIIVRRDMCLAVLHVEYDFAEDMREILPSLLDNLSDWGSRLESKRKSPL